ATIVRRRFCAGRDLQAVAARRPESLSISQAFAMGRNLKITLQYDGAAFHGWQMQPGLPTIQGVLADTIRRVTGEKVFPQGSGRTDAGVHALAQVASCVLESPIPPANLVVALNDLLPAAIRVTCIEPAAADFHARFSARSKTYRYRVLRSAICPPHLARYVYHHPYPLDVPAMQQAAAVVLGEHDFTSFAAVDPEKVTVKAVETGTDNQVKASEREVSNRRTVTASQWECDADEMTYTIAGNGFLHHMVRNLVGTFLLVGKGTLTAEDVSRILRLKNRSAAGATAPASGLWLLSVEY
ncbi:MAG: tRNA pseudouridine(38-40) synthase TruA, partial [Candidatus Acidiferrum sp.]